MNPTNLLGLTQEELADFTEHLGESRYRGKQLFGWMYEKGVSDFRLMTDLGKSFRELLQEAAVVSGIQLVARQQSRTDNTTKFLWQLADGAKIESVLIPPSTSFTGDEAAGEEEQRRLTLCVSTQVGCPLDCKFCATASMGYTRNLTAGEIVDQVLQARKLSPRKITNVVFMGMGEPLMNYDNVMAAADIFATGVGVALRRITVSTAGWAERIRQMADENRKVKLAVSLHSADDETRIALMPINKRFPLHDLTEALEYYHSRTRKRVTYEYIFFDGVNDSDAHVVKLIRLARRVPSKINIIPFHSIDFTAPRGFSAHLKASPRTPAIVDRLRREGLTVFLRSSAGEDIDAACGQLAVKMSQRSKASSARGGEIGHPSRTQSPSRAVECD